MNLIRSAIRGSVLALLALVALPALAVIDVKIPLGKMFVQSKSITAGEITKITADTRIVELKPSASFKGAAPADAIKIQIKDPASLIDDLAAKNAAKTIIIFDGARSAAIHAADHWYSAAAGNRPGIYIIDARKTDLDPTFPGKTADLVKALEKLQAQVTEKSPTTAPATNPSATRK
jgi:hypothetical protein